MKQQVMWFFAGFAGLSLSIGASPSALQQPGAGERVVSHYDEAKLSKPVYQVKMEHNVRIPMRDGVTLSADIYRPDVEDKFPVILVRTPYSNNTPAAVEQSKFFAQRGYACVQVDVRGRYDSDGTFYAFRNEPDDGFDTDEWVGTQPWSNGKIGTMGGSYVGFTQLTQAIRGSQYLVAMAPTVTTLNTYGNWFYTGGAFQYGFALSWGGLYIDGRINQEYLAYNWPEALKHLPIATADEAVGRRTPHYRDWVGHPTRDSYWDQNSHENEQDKIAVPLLNAGGWYDIFLAGMLQDDVEIRKRGNTELARRGKRLMVGPWVHTIGTRSNSRAEAPFQTDRPDFGVAAELDMQRVYLRWFDYWLRGIDNGVASEPPIQIFVMGDNYWRYENEWPLARTQYTKYYLQSGGKANSLHGDGTLSTDLPKGGSPTDIFLYDPRDPISTLGGNNCCRSDIVPMGPFDQRAVERREDVLVYTSPELEKPVEVTGPILVRLFAATTAKDTDWTAKLVDVHANGSAQNIQDGIIRARYRESNQRASFIEPGKVHEYAIDLWATSNTFLPGHRIRVEISSSNFPRFDRNLNTSEDPATGTRMETARQTIHHSPQYPSHIVLPLIPRAAASGPTGQR
jgi:putative CocE/NonD family hydrolase